MIAIVIISNALVLSFSMHLVSASGTIYIRADGSIDPSSVAISTNDNITYTLIGDLFDSIVVERNNIVFTGSGYSVQGPGSGIGISLFSTVNVTIEKFRINGFACGIHLNLSYLVSIMIGIVISSVCDLVMAGTRRIMKECSHVPSLDTSVQSPS